MLDLFSCYLSSLNVSFSLSLAKCYMIARMDTQQGMSLDYLSAPEKAVALQHLLLDLLLKGIGGWRDNAAK